MKKRVFFLLIFLALIFFAYLVLTDLNKREQEYREKEDVVAQNKEKLSEMEEGDFILLNSMWYPITKKEEFKGESHVFIFRGSRRMEVNGYLYLEIDSLVSKKRNPETWIPIASSYILHN
jgi:hypothetical protein